MERLAAALELFALIQTTAEHVRRAKQVQRLLATKHQRGRKVPGLLVAAAAETEGLIVFHYDADFDRIATVTGPAQRVGGASRLDRLIRAKPDAARCQDRATLLTALCAARRHGGHDRIRRFCLPGVAGPAVVRG